MKNVYPLGLKYWLLFMVALLAAIFSTALVAQNSVISKPITMFVDLDSKVWHVHECYDQQNHVVLVALKPAAWNFGTTVWAVHIDRPDAEFIQSQGGNHGILVSVGHQWNIQSYQEALAMPIVQLPDGTDIYQAVGVDNRVYHVRWNTIEKGYLNVDTQIRIRLQLGDGQGIYYPNADGTDVRIKDRSWKSVSYEN